MKQPGHDPPTREAATSGLVIPGPISTACGHLCWPSPVRLGLRRGAASNLSPAALVDHRCTRIAVVTTESVAKPMAVSIPEALVLEAPEAATSGPTRSTQIVCLAEKAQRWTRLAEP
jgi:hypothetical protein